MSVAVTTPLTISELLDRGFQLFKQVLPKVLPLTVIAAMVGASPGLLFPVQKGVKTGIAHPAAFGGWVVLCWLITLTVYVALIRKIDDVAEGRNQLSLVDAYFGGLKKLPAVLGSMLLFGFIIMGGLVLLVIPGIIFMLSMSFFLYFLALEGKGPVDSLKCSHQLVWGHWWRWAGIYTVALIVFMGLYAVMALVAGVSSVAVAGGDASTGLLLANFLTKVVVTTVSTPFIYSVQLIGFRELQLRKGGGDLAARIAQAA